MSNKNPRPRNKPSLHELKNEEDWIQAFQKALTLLHEESELSTSSLHAVLDSIEDKIDQIRASELLIDDENF